MGMDRGGASAGIDDDSAQTTLDPVSRRTEESSGSLGHRLSVIVEQCRDFSRIHRLSYATEGVFERIHGVLKDYRALFQEWTLEICLLLEHCGTLRYNELLGRLPGISTRTLASKLTQLGEFGFVRRTVYDESPPRVEYELSEKGREFVDLFFPTIVHIATEAKAP